MLGSGTQPQHLISSPSRTQPHQPKRKKKPTTAPKSLLSTRYASQEGVPAARGAEIRHRIEQPAARFGRALEERPIPRRIEQSNRGIGRGSGDLGLEGRGAKRGTHLTWRAREVLLSSAIPCRCRGFAALVQRLVYSVLGLRIIRLGVWAAT